ncbi:MAG: DUF4252 domain-containing protein [Saprospiraceae bacterium]|nr:DUF4252 domain-containing protein [Saprospiraceae bacterium]
MKDAIQYPRSDRRLLRGYTFLGKRVRLLLIAISLLAIHSIKAQDFGLYWKYKDYDGAIAVTLPRWTTGLGSMFLDTKDERKLLRKVHKVRVLFFQDQQNPISDRDMKKFLRKAGRRNLDELVTVRSGKTRVHILAKERRKAIRKVVVLVSTEDGSGIVSMKGKFKLDDINKTINKVQQKTKKGDKKPIVPENVKIPVSRV